MITPNVLTLLRILIGIVCPILLFQYRSFPMDLGVIAAFAVACLTDWWDGHLARTRLMVTRFGKIMDPIADKLLIVGFMSTLSLMKFYPFEWIALIFVREFAVTMARFIKLGKGNVIPAEWAGKMKVCFQYGSILSTLLLMTALDSSFLGFDSSPALQFLYALHYLGILLAVILTLCSGLIFFHRLAE